MAPATAKAIAERDAGREDNILTKGKLNTAISRVKQVEHEQYVDRKAIRTNALKTEEDHKFALSELSNKFYEELEGALEDVEMETSKRLVEEARHIKAEQKHAQRLRTERQFYATKLEKEQLKLTKERRGQALLIDHLHDQWNERMSATKLRMKTDSEASTAKVMISMEQKEEKAEKKNAKAREKLTNKLEKKEEKLETVLCANQNRYGLCAIFFIQYFSPNFILFVYWTLSQGK